MESAAKIRRLVLRDGRSIRSVSRSTGLSRNTIKKYLKDATPPIARQAMLASLKGALSSQSSAGPAQVARF